MPTYNFTCTVCGAAHEVVNEGGPPASVKHCGQPAKRQWGFAIKSSFQEGFNPSVGMYVSNRKILNDALKVASDQASEHTQLTHNFVMRDPQDHAAFGLSDSDVAEAKEYGERLKRGELPRSRPEPDRHVPSAVPPGVNGGWETVKR